MADKERILANNSELLKVLTMIENVSDAEPLIFNDFLGDIDYGSYLFDFISNGVKYDGIQIVMLGPPVKTMRYCKLSEDGELVPEPGIIYGYNGAENYGANLYWLDDVYKTIYVLKKPDSLLFSYWLASNVHLDGGVDTSHGTALPEHICSGFKAVVKGQLLDGTLAVAYGGITSQVEPYDVDYMGSIGMEKTYDEPTAIYPQHGSTVMLFAPYSAFGDATPADVAKGKIFTSAAGFLSEGEAEIGGTDVDDAKSIVERTIITYSNKEVKTVGTRAFSHCASLVSVDLPEVITIGQHGFNSCHKLERVEFPKLTTLLPGDNFTYCYMLKYADLGLVSNLPGWSLANTPLETVILRKSDKICTLQATNALSDTPIAKGTGYIYVPSALVDSYKTATNWSTFADQFRAIEDYPHIDE